MKIFSASKPALIIENLKTYFSSSKPALKPAKIINRFTFSTTSFKFLAAPGKNRRLLRVVLPSVTKITISSTPDRDPNEEVKALSAA